MSLALDGWVGRKVRLRRSLMSRSGFVHLAGTELRVVSHVHGRFTLEDPAVERGSWSYEKVLLRQVWPSDVARVGS